MDEEKGLRVVRRLQPKFLPSLIYSLPIMDRV